MNKMLNTADTPHNILLMYQNRWKHSKKQSDAGKRKY